jgi:hypothetical protein
MISILSYNGVLITAKQIETEILASLDKAEKTGDARA